MRIYFAAPLFNSAEREYNERLTATLEVKGNEVFLPQRDGVESIDSITDREGIETDEDVMTEIYRIDRQALLDSDAVIAVLDGRVPDEGVMIELGIANEHGIPAFGLKTDLRTFSPRESLNAMVFGVLDELVEDENELLEALDRYRP